MRGSSGEEQNRVGEERRNKTVTDFCSSLPFSRYTALIYAEPGTKAHSVLGRHLVWTRLTFTHSHSAWVLFRAPALALSPCLTLLQSPDLAQLCLLAGSPSTPPPETEWLNTVVLQSQKKKKRSSQCGCHI